MAQTQVIEGTGEELIPLLNQEPNQRFRLIKLPPNGIFRTFEAGVALATSRTAEQIASARARVLGASPPPRELPDGKTLEDVIVGQWPGDETNDQILDALEKLS